MSSLIQLQSDLGTLGIHGLGAFSTILATLSADNVAPMALIQLERLGSLFNTSGQFAKKVPDLLTRVKSHPIGRLAVTVGWRKGDSASLLAETAGGQATALLSVVLANLFKQDDCGEVLAQLSSQLLPSQSAVASISQLADAAQMLAQKLFVLGFGNFLAEQVLRIHNAYQSLGAEVPSDLLGFLTVDGAVNLFNTLSRALREENKFLRISGTSTMGHVLALVLFMFPRDTTVTIEDIVIHEGEHQCILIQLARAPLRPVAIQLEDLVSTSGPLDSPITIEGHQQLCFDSRYHFAWHGWLARKIQVEFLEVGLVCTHEVLTAVCDLLVAVCNHDIKPHGAGMTDNCIPKYRLAAMLEPYSRHRMAGSPLGTKVHRARDFWGVQHSLFRRHL